ncbi:MAG: tRNA pseudouridine(13) synthase TruD [Pseudomonadales bacterium]|nr:tRNA pseudouridine(13) synthase TruD [Pseudomonadales bacterium]
MKEADADRRRPRAGAVAGSGRIRSEAADFAVDEWIEMVPEGTGEHLWLRVRKSGENTEHVARLLAQSAGVAPRAVGYAGRKDRHAVATQWFSVQLPGRADPPRWKLPSTVEILESVRRLRKLQVGGLRGNRFRIVVRGFVGDAALLDTRLAWIGTQGVPNYFGTQRFGRGGGNLAQACAWFGGEAEVRDRKLRGLLISAARAEIFNSILAARVADGSWCAALPGDLMIFEGRGSFFAVDDPDALPDDRLVRGEIHPSGALWGRGRPATTAGVGELECASAAAQPELAGGLERVGLQQERRALRLMPHEMVWEWLDPGTLRIEFRLNAGCYATTVLDEVLDCRDAGATPGA